MPTTIFFLLTFLFTTFHLPSPLSPMPILPDPDPFTVQTQVLNRPPTATIPAFPEQPQTTACPLDLHENLFHDIRSACGHPYNQRPGQEFYSDELNRGRCCPVLAAWIYSAYSQTGLLAAAIAARSPPAQSATYDMPVLPDDSETCVDNLEKALAAKGIQLPGPNATCDVVYCYCGIRLHPFSCPEAFWLNTRGELVGGESVKRLERDCFNGGQSGGLGGCSDCLNSLYLLKGDGGGRSNRIERKSKMQMQDCELLGLSWLLNNNRSAYIHTVSAVLRAIMMNPDDDSSHPPFCTLNSDGMPLAVDSSQINSQSSSTSLETSIYRSSSLFLSFSGILLSAFIKVVFIIL